MACLKAPNRYTCEEDDSADILTKNLPKNVSGETESNRVNPQRSSDRKCNWRSPENRGGVRLAVNLRSPRGKAFHYRGNGK